MVVLDYIANLKRGLGLPFAAHFLHDFSLFNAISMDKVSMPQLFSSQDIKQNVLLSSYLDS